MNETYLELSHLSWPVGVTARRGSVASSRWPVEMTTVPRRQTTTTAPAATKLPDIELRPGL